MSGKRFTAFFVICWRSRETGKMGHSPALWNIKDALNIVRCRNEDPNRKFDWWFELSQDVVCGEHYEKYNRRYYD